MSTDSTESHRQFAEEHELTFPLLSGTEGRVSSAFGVTTALGITARTTFVIDQHGFNRRIFPDVDPAVHVDEVTQVLETLNRVQ